MEVLTRIWTDLIGRLTGPLTFRLFLQPAMATLLALHHGLRDARVGRPPYMTRVFSNPEERRRALREGWKDIGKVIILAIVLDVVYEFIVFRRMYPFESVDVAIILAIIPYCLVRGTFSRIARLWVRRDAA